MKTTLKKAWMKSLSVMVGYLLIGCGFGMVVKKAGLSIWTAMSMSLFIYAGSMQYIGVSLISGAASLLTAAMTTLLVNARHFFYALTMLKRYQRIGKGKNYSIFALTDETYALLADETDQSDAFLIWVSAFNHLYWLIGTACGFLFAQLVPIDLTGIEFSMTALFIASFTQQLIDRKYPRAAWMGLIVTLICLFLFSHMYFLLPSMVVICMLLLCFPRFFDQKE